MVFSEQMGANRRRLSVRIGILMGVLMLFAAACGDGSGGTTTSPSTTAATSTTSTSAPTTTTTEPVFAGILVVIPEACDGCSELITELETVSRGEVPIEVRNEGERPAVRILDTNGSLVKEWVGVENTIHPNDRATAANAFEMIKAACDALESCSPDTTSTTTTFPRELVLQPNDFVCGMEVERRFSLDGVEPAPLGVIGDSAGIAIAAPEHEAATISAILMGFGRTDFPEYLAPFVEELEIPEDEQWYYYADFCIGDDAEGEPITFSAVVSYGGGLYRDDVYVVSNRWPPENDAVYPTNILPFGRSPEAAAASLQLSESLMSPDDFLARLVVGRQYVIWLVFGNDGLDAAMPWRHDLIRFLDSELSEPPEHTDMSNISIWVSPTGRP